MNFFFGLKTETLFSEIQIPCFQNKHPKSKNVFLYQAFIENGIWKFERLDDCRINDDFFLIKKDLIENNKIYFIAEKKEINFFSNNELKNLSSFTQTWPAFRANLKLFIKDGGFSSYQSEYPYSMIIKNGTILSPINVLCNKEADKNFIFFRNIYKQPKHEIFNGYLVDIKKKTVETKFEFKTNYSNLVELKNDLIKPEIFFITEKYLGVPMFISTNKKHISFEHTHPPHEYILSNNRFELIKKLKTEINEIIDQKNL
jgi:hypothetical protein